MHWEIGQVALQVTPFAKSGLVRLEAEVSISALRQQMLLSESSGRSRILKRRFQYVIKARVARLLKGSGACPCKKFGISDLRLFLVGENC